ncbi:hypothetical protein FACS189447_02490 [Spirochaetia bacterium]|nr:hypothetical protein FACS189447_02490 [Spirochaetia bacterium]
MGASDPFDYVQKAHAAIDHYSKIDLLNDRIILISDFNSNKIWDTCYQKDRNHSAMIDNLGKKGIKNCSKSADDNDNRTYYYLSNGQDRQVIGDFCFASVKLADYANVLVPGADEWIPDEKGQKY